MGTALAVAPGRSGQSRYSARPQRPRGLARVCQFGLGTPSFVPARELRELRALSRYRRTLVGQRSRVRNRVGKVVDRSGARVGGVAKLRARALEDAGGNTTSQRGTPPSARKRRTAIAGTRTSRSHPVGGYPLTHNTVQVQGSEHPFEQLTVPTELQRTAFELLKVKLAV